MKNSKPVLVAVFLVGLSLTFLNAAIDEKASTEKISFSDAFIKFFGIDEKSESAKLSEENIKNYSYLQNILIQPIQFSKKVKLTRNPNVHEILNMLGVVTFVNRYDMYARIYKGLEPIRMGRITFPGNHFETRDGVTESEAIAEALGLNSVGEANPEVDPIQRAPSNVYVILERLGYGSAEQIHNYIQNYMYLLSGGSFALDPAGVNPPVVASDPSGPPPPENGTMTIEKVNLDPVTVHGYYHYPPRSQSTSGIDHFGPGFELGPVDLGGGGGGGPSPGDDGGSDEPCPVTEAARAAQAGDDPQGSGGCTPAPAPTSAKRCSVDVNGVEYTYDDGKQYLAIQEDSLGTFRNNPDSIKIGSACDFHTDATVLTCTDGQWCDLKTRLGGIAACNSIILPSTNIARIATEADLQAYNNSAEKVGYTNHGDQTLYCITIRKSANGVVTE